MSLYSANIIVKTQHQGTVATMSCGRTLLQFWKTATTILAPILLCPLVFYIGTSEAKCGFVILLMAVFWVTDAVPLPVTALLPVVLLPLFGLEEVMRSAGVNPHI